MDICSEASWHNKEKTALEKTCQHNRQQQKNVLREAEEKHPVLLHRHPKMEMLGVAFLGRVGGKHQFTLQDKV